MCDYDNLCKEKKLDLVCNSDVDCAAPKPLCKNQVSFTCLFP
jgi:hypothetical protein